MALLTKGIGPQRQESQAAAPQQPEQREFTARTAIGFPAGPMNTQSTLTSMRPTRSDSPAQSDDGDYDGLTVAANSAAKLKNGSEFQYKGNFDEAVPKLADLQVEDEIYVRQSLCERITNSLLYLVTLGGRLGFNMAAPVPAADEGKGGTSLTKMGTGDTLPASEVDAEEVDGLPITSAEDARKLKRQEEMAPEAAAEYVAKVASEVKAGRLKELAPALADKVSALFADGLTSERAKIIHEIAIQHLKGMESLGDDAVDTAVTFVKKHFFIQKKGEDVVNGRTIGPITRSFRLAQAREKNPLGEEEALREVAAKFIKRQQVASKA